jgi:hypothetical protein
MILYYGVLFIVGCLAVLMASTHEMPLMPLLWEQFKMSPDLVKYLLRRVEKSASDENHCP